MEAKRPHLHSLRKRAIYFSTAISLLIVVISISGYSNFKKLHHESSLNLIKRDKLLVRLNLIRSELLDSYKELNNFLLEPENLNYQKSIIVSVKEAQYLSSHLKEHDWIKKYNKTESATELDNKLRLLGHEVARLIKVRLDVNNQFPTLAVGSEIMQPNRNKLNNSIALAMNEMDTDNTQVENPQVYRTLVQIRHLWSQVLSNSRLYLANRVGSFNEDALPVQENAIEIMFAELKSNLVKLKQYADAGKLGFEGTDAVDVMQESSQGWFEGFKRVKIINHSDEWRQDAKIMKENISPTITSIVELLIDLEEVITESSKDDVELVDSLANSQNMILWLIAFIGIFFTIAIILSLDKLIFKPIAMISKALKFEALGKKSDDLPIVKSKETEDLINAFYEMSRQVHLRQTELEYHALHDALTSLPNRTLLLDRIEHSIYAAKRESHNVSLLILDLNNFKEINDTLGHMAGDNLLIEAGSRISQVLREVDTVARIGGDEFAVLLPHTNEEQAIVTSQKILSSFNNTFEIEDIDVSVSASIGIGIYPDHGEDVHSLLRYADIAMYVAKRNKTGFEVYNEKEDEHSVKRLSMTQDFRDAISNDKLTVNFQPIINMKDEELISVEALSRWHHPEHGYISPEKFIFIAEQSGLINALTYWVLNKCIEQVSIWHKSGARIIAAVNLSVFSFKDPDFISEVRCALKKYDFPGEYLKLEITESAMMENPLQATDVMTELHKMGIKLSIDDFGTGFSSMAYLKKLPVDELKIDKSFVIGLDNDKSNDAIVRSTIDLAHNLGLKVVAEGIETEEVYGLLNQYQCDMAQGYFLSQPVPAKELEQLLTRNN